jgi:hypothetical protein
MYNIMQDEITIWIWWSGLGMSIFYKACHYDIYHFFCLYIHNNDVGMINMKVYRQKRLLFLLLFSVQIRWRELCMFLTEYIWVVDMKGIWRGKLFFIVVYACFIYITTNFDIHNNNAVMINMEVYRWQRLLFSLLWSAQIQWRVFCVSFVS